MVSLGHFTNGITTPLHDNNYKGLMTNSGTPSFLVGTQGIGPHEVSFMSQSCLHFLFIQSLYSFSISRKNLFTSLFSFFFTIDISFHNHSREMGYSVAIAKPWLGALQC